MSSLFGYQIYPLIPLLCSFLFHDAYIVINILIYMIMPLAGKNNSFISWNSWICSHMFIYWLFTGFNFFLFFSF